MRRPRSVLGGLVVHVQRMRRNCSAPGDSAYRVRWRDGSMCRGHGNCSTVGGVLDGYPSLANPRRNYLLIKSPRWTLYPMFFNLF